MSAMADLRTSWEKAVNRTPLPNTRLMQEYERIHHVARLRPMLAASEIQRGIETFEAYAAATDNEIARMAYRGVVRLDQDPQGDIDRQCAAATEAAAAARPRLSVVEMVNRLRDRGITLAVTREGTLAATGRLSDPDRALLREHKAAILQIYCRPAEVF